MIGVGNGFSFASLILWVPLLFFIYRTQSLTRATLIGMFGGMLYLPEATSFDFPAVPEFDKESITSFWCIIFAWTAGKARFRAARPLRGIDLFIVLGILAEVGSVLTNGDPLFYPGLMKPGLTPYDLISVLTYFLMRFAIPFLLARAVFRTSGDLVSFLQFIAVSMAIYNIWVLVEIRFSPQMHTWVYGFFPHSWGHSVRGDGFRPSVFMPTGLALVMAMLAGVWACAMTKRTNLKVGPVKGALPLIFIAGTLCLCRSSAVLVYGAVVLPLWLWASPRTQVNVAFGLGIFVLLYPVLRLEELVPIKGMVEWAAALGEERADSLAFRFDNEEMLLGRVKERMLFGWSGYNRAGVVDLKTGEELSVFDGAWIIFLTARGVLGFIARMGMVVVPIFMARRTLKLLRDKNDKVRLAGLALLVAVNAVDLLPNGLFSYFPLFCSGALAGLSVGMLTEQRQLRKKDAADKVEGAAQATELGAPTSTPPQVTVTSTPTPTPA